MHVRVAALAKAVAKGLWSAAKERCVRYGSRRLVTAATHAAGQAVLYLAAVAAETGRARLTARLLGVAAPGACPGGQLHGRAEPGLTALSGLLRRPAAFPPLPA